MELVYGSIEDFALCRAHVAGCEALVHTTVLFTGGDGDGAPGEFAADSEADTKSWLVE